MSRAPGWLWVRRLLWYGFLVAIAGALLMSGVGAATSLHSQHEGWSYRPLVFASILLVFHVAAVLGAWGILLRGSAAPAAVSLPVVVHSFSLGWLARYVPGPPLAPAGKFVAAHRARLPPEAIGRALVHEQALQLSAFILLPALTAGFLFGHHALWITPAGVALAIALGVAAWSSRTSRWVEAVTRRLRMPPTSPLAPVPRGHAVVPGALLAGSGLMAAAAFHLVAVAVAPWDGSDVGSGLFIFSSAMLIGYVAPFAPAGVGVRETVIVALMAPVVGPAPALAAAVVSRAIAVLVDIVLVPLALGLVLLLPGRPADATRPVPLADG